MINLIFQKDKGDTDLGFVYVNIRENGKQKRISTKIKISKNQFVFHKNKELPKFNDTKLFDYVSFNSKITEIVESYNRGDVKEQEMDFITFFESKNKLQLNGGTKATYDVVCRKLKSYYPTLSFGVIDDNFLRVYKEQLLAEKLTVGYVAHNLVIIGMTISKANKELGTKIVYDISELGLSKNKKRKEHVLSDDDISKLMEFDVKEKNIEYVTFGLMQLFGNGCRFSDLILLKFKHFKKDGIKIQQPKNKGHLKIPYSVMIIRVMYGYLFRDTPFTKTELSNIISFGLANNQDHINLLLKNIMEHVSRQPRNDFFFSFSPNDLKDYDASRSFNVEENKALHRIRGSYNSKLNYIAKRLKFSIPRLSSHAFRYKFVSNCLEMKISYYEISKCLNHSTLAVTEAYIVKNFDYHDSKEVANVVDTKYLGVRTELAVPETDK